MSIAAPKIFLIAGEASGDILGAYLMQSLQRSCYANCIGIGGPLMEEEGLTSLTPMDELCVMGLWEVIMQLPRLLKLINGVVEEIEKESPDIVVTIDLPDFNFQVAKRLKKRGIYTGKIIHYVAPTVWAWRPGRAKKIASFLDGIMCLFPFEPPYFDKHGLSASYVGHPVVNQDPRMDASNFRKEYGIKEDDFVFGVYLGSRESEIKRHRGIFRDVLQFMLEQYPNMQVVIPTMPGMEFDALQVVEDLKIAPILIANPKKKWEIMRNCNLALAVSGTVGLELAYMNVPHVIGYKVHPITWVILRLLVKVKFAHLANILLDRNVVPEFLQTKCRSIIIATELTRLLKDDALIAKQRMAFHDVRKILKKGIKVNPSDTAAAYIIKQME